MGADPASRYLRQRHWTMLLVASMIIAASFFLRLQGSDAVRLPWADVALPPVCSSRLLFGVECPGCGLTRSFVALAAGDLSASWRYHRVGWLMALAVVGQIPYRVCGLIETRTRIVPRTWPAWLGYLLIASLIVNWLLKMGGV